MAVLRVVDWTRHFENNRTRDLKRMGFVCVPNKMDGDGYTELLDHVDGDRHYACWIALLQVASKCDPRGTLLRDGDRPHDSRSICRISRMRFEVMEKAIERLISIGWLERISISGEEVTKIPQDGAGKPQEGAEKHPLNGMEWNGEERNGIEKEIGGKPPRKSKVREAYDSDFESWWQAYPRREGKKQSFAEWKSAVDRISERVGGERAKAVEFLFEAVSAFSKSKSGSDIQFIVWPERWLRNERYDDDRSAWTAADQSRGGNGGVSGSSGPRIRDGGLLDQLEREVASARECPGGQP